MTVAADPVASFEPHRRRLMALAYRMLGSVAEAEDIVQEAWLRWHAAERGEVADPGAFLSRVASRLCLDHLRSARVRRLRALARRSRAGRQSSPFQPIIGHQICGR